MNVGKKVAETEQSEGKRKKEFFMFHETNRHCPGNSNGVDDINQELCAGESHKKWPDIHLSFASFFALPFSSCFFFQFSIIDAT